MQAYVPPIGGLTLSKANPAGLEGAAAANPAAGTQGPSMIPPTQADIRNFAAAKSAALPEIGAQAPRQPDRIASDITQRLDSLAENYNNAGRPDAAARTDKAAMGGGKAEGAGAASEVQDHFHEMFSRFQDMQMFTVRANLVTNGASSSTHTFNSLLKGQ